MERTGPAGESVLQSGTSGKGLRATRLFTRGEWIATSRCGLHPRGRKPGANGGRYRLPRGQSFSGTLYRFNPPLKSIKHEHDTPIDPFCHRVVRIVLSSRL